MGYWIYMQAFLDVALLLAVAALIVKQRRRPSAKAWQREVGALVDTLSELVVEVDRVTAPRPPAASGDAPAQAAPIDESALAEAVFSGDDGPAFLPAEAGSGAASDSTNTVQSDAPAPAARPGGLLDEVLACAREGLSPEDIARRVGRPVGEVTLMLGLSRAHAVPAGR